MISKKISLGVVTLCILALVFSLAAASSAWAGTYLFSKEITGGPIFNSLAGPVDIDVGPDGKMFIADEANGRVVMLTEFGTFFWQCKFPNNFLTLAISADHTGDFYYVTKWNGFESEVVKMPAARSCTPEYTLVPWPTPFDAPFGIDVAPDGSVYVADTNNDRIAKFNLNGVFLKEWVTFRSDADAFHGPMDVVFYGDGIVLVADTEADRVIAFNIKGDYLAEAGIFGTGQLQFFDPSGLAVGPDRGIYISDTGNNRIQKAFIDGTFAGEFGHAELSSPNGLAVNNGGNVSVADIGNDRIAFFTPDVIVLDKGAAGKVVNLPGQVSLNIDIQPDAYWINVPVEVFAFAGRAGSTGTVAYLTVFPPTGDTSEWALVGLKQITPLVSGLMVRAVNDFPWVVVNDTTGLFPGDWEVSVCFDRQINGRFNPSSSVCDSINVTLQ